MSIIELKDTPMDVVFKMSKGNPGAMTTIMMILRDGEKIDPQAFAGGLGKMLLLDSYEIYGTDIYILFNDKCDRSIRKMCLLLRAVQLGFYPKAKLQFMAKDQLRKVNLSAKEWNEINTKVCSMLEKFQKPEKGTK
jgi:hypothetical protein